MGEGFAAGECELVRENPISFAGRMIAEVGWNPTDQGVAALGLPQNSDSAPSTGKVLIYDISGACLGGQLLPNLTLEAPGAPAGEQFGAGIAIDQRRMAITALTNGVDQNGRVYLYERGASNAEWDFITTLTLPRDLATQNCRAGQGATASLTPGAQQPTDLDATSLVVGCPGQAINAEGVYTGFARALFADGFELN